MSYDYMTLAQSIKNTKTARAGKEVKRPKGTKENIGNNQVLE